MQVITSKQNNEIKFIRHLLHNSRFRRKEKCFVIEGLKLVEFAIDNKVEIKKIFYSSSFIKTQKGKNVLSKAIMRKISLGEIADNVFNFASSLSSPEGILAILEEKRYSLCDIEQNKKSAIVVLDKIQDPGNLGTIIRIADAVKYTGVILTNNCCDMYNPKVLRATAASVFNIPVIEANQDEVIDFLERNKIKIILTLPKGNINCFDFKFTLPFALVFGNESHGISKKFMEIDSTSVKIPIWGKAESLNVAVSAGILLYETARQIRD